VAEGVRLSALLPERLDSVAEQVRTRLCDDKQVSGMKLAWDFIGDQLLDALKSVLDCDLLEVLAGAWARAAPLAALADPDKHPPGERSVIELGKHDVSRELKPVIAVTVASCPCVELNFLLVVAAHVGGVRLSVVDGHIVGGDLGELWASVQLSFEGVPLHPPTESAKVAIPGEFHFAPPGIAIPRLARAAVEGKADGG
jgi:hypothetical protein